MYFPVALNTLVLIPNLYYTISVLDFLQSLLLTIICHYSLGMAQINYIFIFPFNTLCIDFVYENFMVYIVECLSRFHTKGLNRLSVNWNISS